MKNRNILARPTIWIPGIAVVASLLLNLPIWATAIAILLLFASLVITGAGLSRQLIISDPMESVSNNNRVRLKPFVKMHGEIAELIESKKDNPSLSVIGAEALEESAAILQSAVHLLGVRDELTDILAERSPSDPAELAARAELATDETERSAYAAAASARQSEAQHYEKVKEAITRIDLDLQSAEAGLAELKSRLSVSAATGAEESAGELRQSLSRLKALNSGLDEADALLQELK